MGDPKPRYEYIVLYHHKLGWGRWGLPPDAKASQHNLEEVLNEYAEEGWEFRAISEVWNGTAVVSTVILRQRI